MSLRRQMIELVRLHRLHHLPRISHDVLEIQARHFAEATRAYADASAREWAAALGEQRPMRLGASELEFERFTSTAQLYAPALIGALAAALLQQEEGCRHDL